MAEHLCAEYRERVVISEGDDVFVERCNVCGKVRMESDGVRPMAWYATPGAAWPWKYAYADPRNTLDGPEVWRHLKQ
jgi:hypothetical protein